MLHDLAMWHDRLVMLRFLLRSFVRGPLFSLRSFVRSFEPGPTAVWFRGQEVLSFEVREAKRRNMMTILVPHFMCMYRYES